MSESQSLAEACAKVPMPSLTGHGAKQTLPDWMQPWTITGFFYRIMLSQNEKERENAVWQAPPEMLEGAVQYVQCKDLKKKILKTIRDKEMRKFNHNSIIINEITGLYKFVRKAVRYTQLTAKMYLDG